MKKIRLYRWSLVFVVFTFSYGISFSQDTNQVYKVVNVDNKVWTISENGWVNIYLVAGNDSALLIDTGDGNGDLKGFIKTLTNLPLVVVETHGHPDHIRNIHQFEKIFMNEGDTSMIYWDYRPDNRRTMILEKMKDRNLSEEELNAMINVKLPAFNLIKDGYIFDLGGRKLEVVTVPGHTHGSICLLDKQNKMLFTGDNNNSLSWLFLKSCYPLEVYLQSLEKLEKRSNEFTLMFPGHGTPVDNEFIAEQIGCAKSILNGTCTPEPYSYGDLTSGTLLCKYKRAQIAYDPNNLRLVK